MLEYSMHRREGTLWGRIFSKHSAFSIYLCLVCLFLIILLPSPGYSAAIPFESLKNNASTGMRQLSGDETRVIESVTGQGKITFKLLLYDTNAVDPETPMEGQDMVWFTDCNVMTRADFTLAPPYGEFPYGFWRCTMHLAGNFKHERYRIILKISFEGPIDPLNAKYCEQEYDLDEKKIVWVESEDSPRYSPDVGEHSIYIRLIDARPSDDQDIRGYGDINTHEYIVEHRGGLLWPIPGGGRCFILTLPRFPSINLR